MYHYHDHGGQLRGIMKNIYTYFLMLFALCIYTPTFAANEQYPLEAPDISSPRATLESFQTLIRDMKPIVDKIRTLGLSREIKRELVSERYQI
jgi:hypothetical protein